MAEYFLTKLILITLSCTRCISVFVNRCQGNVAVPDSTYYAQNLSTFGKEIQCASECMADLVCLSYFFRDIRSGTSNCIHVPNIYDCSGLDIGDYIYKTKVGNYPIPATCIDARKYTHTHDGEYCLKVGDGTFGTRIYCHNMSSDTPEEYITLLAGREENYVSSWQHNSNNVHGDVYFEKLRLYVSNLTIAAWDLRFTFSTRWNEGNGNPLSGRGYPLFGRATSCAGLPNGVASMNFTGTGLFIPAEVQRMSVAVSVNVFQEIRSTDNQYALWECNGNCGSCVPQNTSLDAVTYDLPSLTDKILPLAYDRKLDRTSCEFKRDRAGVYIAN